MINYDEKIIYHGVKDSNHRMMLPSHHITKSDGNCMLQCYFSFLLIRYITNHTISTLCGDFYFLIFTIEYCQHIYS